MREPTGGLRGLYSPGGLGLPLPGTVVGSVGRFREARASQPYVAARHRSAQLQILSRRRSQNAQRRRLVRRRIDSGLQHRRHSLKGADMADEELKILVIDDN